MFHVEVDLNYICYLVKLVFLMRPSGDQPDVPCGPRGEEFAHPWGRGLWELVIAVLSEWNYRGRGLWDLVIAVLSEWNYRGRGLWDLVIAVCCLSETIGQGIMGPCNSSLV